MWKMIKLQAVPEASGIIEGDEGKFDGDDEM